MTCPRDKTRLLLAAGTPRDRGWPCLRATNASLEAGTRGGKQCVRGLRITVYDVPGWLAVGMSKQDILTDYPEARAEPTSAPLLHLPPHRHDVARSRNECLQLRKPAATDLVKQQFHAATRITCCSRSALESAGDKMLGRERRRRARRLLSALRLNLDGPLLPEPEARCRSRSQHLAAPRGQTPDTTQPPPIQRPALAFKPDIGQTTVALSSAATGNTWCCPICGAPRNSGSSHSIR